MMNDANIIIPPETAKFLDERKQIWEAFDESRRQAAQLDTFASQVSDRGSAHLLTALTEKNIPPTELAAIIPELEQELSQVRQLETHIQERQAEIQRIKQTARNLMIALVLSAIVLLLILAFVVHVL